MTEALILLPFFFIAWASVFFGYRAHERRAVVAEKVRACAWTNMSDSCPQDPPPRCRYTSGQQLDGGGLGAGFGEAVPPLMDLAAQLQNFGIDLPGMFGGSHRPTFRSEELSELQRPNVVGGGRVTVRGRYWAMCDEVPAHRRPSRERYNHRELFPPLWCARTGLC